MLKILIVILLIFIIGAISFLSMYIGVRYHKLAKKGCRKIARKLHLYKPQDDMTWTLISDKQKEDLKSAIRITFTGDLILLRDMVARAYVASDDNYCFNPMFEHIVPYLNDADYNIGVFEGPMAGEEQGYSSSNYDDGIPLYINFPDAFGQAVKKAGYDLVTLANNHLLDKGIEGQERTLDVLDSIGLDHIGSYRNREEHDTVCIKQIRNKKVAFLAYTYGCERTSEDFFFDKDTAFRTDSIVRRRSKYYNLNKQKIAADFEKVKKENPDLIIVLPHIGKQFNHYPDGDQRVWCDFFVDQGADIILSCHPHAVQPIEWRTNNDGKKVLIVYCPGNLINSYIEHDGDASMMVETYIDVKTCEPIAASCIPIYCYAPQSQGQYIAYPIKDIVKAEHVNQLSAADYKRVCEVQKLVTRTALGVEIPIHNVQDRYVSFADSGYVRQHVAPLQWEKQHEDSKLLVLLRQAKKVCFCGDSITDGMKNGGYGWYEPMMEMYPKVEVERFALGGQTSRYLSAHRETIAQKGADVYVIAIGCNDIRYRNTDICAMTAKEYIENIRLLCETIQHSNNAKLVLVCPWMSFEPDPYCYVSVEEKERLYDEYTEALQTYAEQIGALFVNPNVYLSQVFKENPLSREAIYLDHIHPNADNGIQIFSKACILYE